LTFCELLKESTLSLDKYLRTVAALQEMGNPNSPFKKADSQGEHPPPLQKIWEMDTKGVDRKKVSVSAPNPPKLCL
jgi:hypothetical protein